MFVSSFFFLLAGRSSSGILLPLDKRMKKADIHKHPTQPLFFVVAGGVLKPEMHHPPRLNIRRAQRHLPAAQSNEMEKTSHNLSFVAEVGTQNAQCAPHLNSAVHDAVTPLYRPKEQIIFIKCLCRPFSSNHPGTERNPMTR